MKSPIFLLGTLLLCGFSTAQVRYAVAPSVQASTEGNGLDQRPFGYDRVRFTQMIGKSLIGSGLPLRSMITALSYRRDGLVFRSTTLRRRNARGTVTPTWTIRMGNLDTSKAPFRVRNRQLFSISRPSPAYLRPGTTANTLRTVFAGKKVSFPSLPPATNPPAPFLIRFPLDTPFLYLGPSGLAIDHYCYESRGALYPYYVDAVRSRMDFGSAKNFGVSCPMDRNRASAIPTNPGSPLPFRLFLHGGMPSSVAVAALGVSKTAFGSLKLPYDLSPLGLKGCSIYVSQDFLLPLPTNASGSVEWVVKVPYDRNLAGGRFFAQWIGIDSRVNPGLPLALSNGIDIVLGKSLGSGLLEGSFVYGANRIQTVNGRYGLVDPGAALVTRFSFK